MGVITRIGKTGEDYRGDDTKILRLILIEFNRFIFY